MVLASPLSAIPSVRPLRNSAILIFCSLLRFAACAFMLAGRDRFVDLFGAEALQRFERRRPLDSSMANGAGVQIIEVALRLVVRPLDGHGRTSRPGAPLCHCIARQRKHARLRKVAERFCPMNVPRSN